MSKKDVRNKIIRLVYDINDQGDYLGGYDTITEFYIDHPDLYSWMVLNTSNKFLYLLWSKYTGRRYHPERFIELIKNG